jgi:hypothetical protein
MKHLKNFEEYNEGKLSNFVAGAAVACAVAACAAAVGTLVEVVAAYDWTQRLP